MPEVDDRSAPEGNGNDARLARWVREHVPNTRVREGEQKTVIYRGEELYALFAELADHFYWLGTEDVQHHAAHMQEFWARGRRPRT